MEEEEAGAKTNRRLNLLEVMWQGSIRGEGPSSFLFPEESVGETNCRLRSKTQ